MSGQSLPLVDVEGFNNQSWLPALDEACREWGCFQLTGHGLSRGFIADALGHMEQFFALEQSEKSALERTEQNPWGYYDRELTKNVRDWKEIFDFGPSASGGPLSASRPQWPARLPGFQPAMEQLYGAMEVIALKLLEGISHNLGMPGEYLSAQFLPDHTSFLRLNHYPPCDNPAEHLGISHHTDAGALTVLLPDGRPGLEFWHEGAWRLVETQGDALVINIGDIVQVWSNDTYVAPLHRVLVNNERHRYSAPFFLNPGYDTNYQPLPPTVEGQPPRYRSINWGEFRAGRAAGDYADLGEEIQIGDFRV